MSNQVEIVLTIPESLGPNMAYLARARTTLGALTQMIAQTQYELIMAAPYVNEETFGHGILQNALQHAVDKRKVQLSIVTTNENLGIFSNIAWIMENQTRVHFLCPKINLEHDHNLGSHAKFCISDRQNAYIGSANLTFLGLHQHLEMGVLIQGVLVKQLYDFWVLLVENGFYELRKLE